MITKVGNILSLTKEAAVKESLIRQIGAWLGRRGVLGSAAGLTRMGAEGATASLIGGTGLGVIKGAVPGAIIGGTLGDKDHRIKSALKGAVIGGAAGGAMGSAKVNNKLGLGKVKTAETVSKALSKNEIDNLQNSAAMLQSSRNLAKKAQSLVGRI